MLQFAPGPIRIPNVIKESFKYDVPYFASNDFSQLFKAVQGKLKKVFNTKNFVLTGNGSGSLGMEVAVTSFFNPGDRVGVITSGKYGDNWHKICCLHKLRSSKFDSSYCPTYYSLKGFEEFCKYHAEQLDGIFVTHFETTSGVLNPIKEYLRIYRENGGKGLFIVDAICSLLTEDLCSDDYDIVIGASQKALSLPPGLFFMSVSDQALRVAKDRTTGYPQPISKNPGELLYYFNVLKEYEYQSKGKSVFTTSAHLINALDVALDFVLLRGRDFIVNKCRENTVFLRDELLPNFERFPEDEGNAVTVFRFNRSPELVECCYERGLVIGSGIRELHNETFRVMSFGWDLSVRSLIEACDIIQKVSKEL